MNSVPVLATGEANDRATTLRNRARLRQNRNLLFWYQQLYRHQFNDFRAVDELSILEVGSGTSPLKLFHPNVLTSDVLQLDYLDLVFDCHNIDKLPAIDDGTLHVITLTNVLHHLRSPIDFLNRAAVKLKPGGKLIATEPFFSMTSSLIFKYLHHEAVDLEITEPELREMRGPLASANIALPWLIFYRDKKWLQSLGERFDLARISLRPFTAISYFATGGISRRLPIPGFLYRVLFAVDLALSRRFPRPCASFFTVTLIRR
ncbi:MAG: class I SAM-dependent methyltransferase [Chthoniobacterales bacterium]